MNSAHLIEAHFMGSCIDTIGMCQTKCLTQWHSIFRETIQIACHLIDDAIIKYEKPGKTAIRHAPLDRYS